MTVLFEILHGSWGILLDSSVYVLFGLLAGGLLKVFVPSGLVASHLGQGKAGSVFKAALFGIPLPICSCGVLPMAVSLKKQGASNGATTAFLISTPESGVDSISITYALLDPLMTVARPVAAFFSAVTAGLTQNLFHRPGGKEWIEESSKRSYMSCSASSTPRLPAHQSFSIKIKSGIRFATGGIWHDIAVWFLIGILLSGAITVLIPEDLLSAYGSGFSAKLVMLVVGIPLYTCATASTPIAAALILKGVSPGAALVYLLVGPATSMASLTVLTGLLGRKATLRYLAALSVSALISGVLLDYIYNSLGISARAVAGQAAELIPFTLQLAGALLLLLLSAGPVLSAVKSLSRKGRIFSASAPPPCSCTGDLGSGSSKPLHDFKSS